MRGKSDHDLVEDEVISRPIKPSVGWRTPRVESYEQENQRQEEELSKTPAGRKDQQKRGLK